MRMDGTHTESELKRLDRKLIEIWSECIGLIKEYEKDGVGVSIAFARNDGDKTKGEITIGNKTSGNRSLVVAALSAMFVDEPDMFLEVLRTVTEMRSDLFRMAIVERPKRDTTLS